MTEERKPEYLEKTPVDELQKYHHLHNQFQFQLKMAS